MNEILDIINILFNKKFQIYKSPIIYDQKHIGYECSLIDDNGDTLSSGTNRDYKLALRVCLAEAIERGYAKKIANNSKLKNDFLINSHPTTCGFAAGFEKNKTKLRSISEGIERWAWSKWIDNKCAMNEISADVINLEMLEKTLLTKFTDYRLFKKSIILNINGEKYDFILVIFIGYTQNGAFPGSRVYLNQNNQCYDFNHSVIEACRILNNMTKSEKIKN